MKPPGLLLSELESLLKHGGMNMDQYKGLKESRHLKPEVLFLPLMLLTCANSVVFTGAPVSSHQ